MRISLKLENIIKHWKNVLLELSHIIDIDKKIPQNFYKWIETQRKKYVYKQKIMESSEIRNEWYLFEKKYKKFLDSSNLDYSIDLDKIELEDLNEENLNKSIARNDYYFKINVKKYIIINVY